MSKTKKRKRGSGGAPGKRPVFRGKPVPYVVRTTGEQPPAVMQAGIIRGLYTDGTPGYALALKDIPREPDGWLWQPEGPGGGEPEFSRVSSIRQRRCMDEGRCQVCSTRVTPERARWVMPEYGPDGPAEKFWPHITTTAPPLCEKCEVLARQHCPKLRRDDPPTFIADGWTNWGCQGDLYDDEARALRSGEFANDDPLATMVLARQRIVHLHNARPRGD